MKWMWNLAGALVLGSAAAAAEVPATAKPDARWQQIQAGDSVFGSAAAPLKERIAAGFRSGMLKKQLGLHYDAFVTYDELSKLDGIGNADRARALAEVAEIALYRLNNLYIASKAASQLAAVPGVTAAQKSLAAQITDKCRRKKTELLPENAAAANRIAARIRQDHPRIFLTRESLPLLRRHVARPDIHDYYLKQVKARAVKAPDQPKLWNGETGQTKTPDSRYIQTKRPSFYGTDAAACALVYLIDGDRAFLDKAVRLLEVSAEALDASYEAGVLAGDDYYSCTVLYMIAAYDWLWSDLTPEQRTKIGRSILNYSARSESEGQRFVVSVGFPEAAGFYGIRMLKWYAALAAIHDNIDEKTAKYLLYEGYTDHEVMLRARDQVTGDDGGVVSTANNYVMGTYLWSTYNYLASFQSATGVNRAPTVRHLKFFPQWCVWSLINGREQQRGDKLYYLHDFGNGDTGNTLKTAMDADLYLYEILHFFPDDPVLKKMVYGCLTENPLDPLRWPNSKFRPLTPVLLYNLPPLPEKFGRPEFSLKEHARFFENLGIVFMRSGSTPQDTYASFVTNKKIVQHRHFDANSFSIYKYDFLALDTGTRIGFKRNDFEHLNAYYAQTVAHNAVLIHMPEEEMPHYWVAPRKPRQYFSHGGQARSTGDRCVAYETNDRFTYVAGNATPVYSAKKCKLALRQFVFVYPDLFVIADRVTSTRPEYRKEWLLHSQNEPAMLDDRTFRFDDGGGRLFCRTLLPGAVKRRVVGGPGHEFEASGRNWELPDEAVREAAKSDKNYLGRYRVEIAPETDRAEEYFLHVIQVGRDDVPAMIATRLVEDERSFGTEFETAGGKWRIAFAKKGPAAGTVKLEKDGKVLLDRPLRADVQPQSGLTD